MQEDSVPGNGGMVENKTDLVPAFVEFGPVIKGDDVCKALRMVPGFGDSIHHGFYYLYEWVPDPLSYLIHSISLIGQEFYLPCYQKKKKKPQGGRAGLREDATSLLCLGAGHF